MLKRVGLKKGDKSMTTSDKLENEFVAVCKEYGGEVGSSLGYRYCDFSKKDSFPVALRLGTTCPSIKVETGYSHVEMFDLEKIEKRFNKSFTLINNRGYIINVRPGVGIATFIGGMKGVIQSEVIEK